MSNKPRRRKRKEQRRDMTHHDSSSNDTVKQIQNEKNMEKDGAQVPPKEADENHKMKWTWRNGDLKTIIIVDL